MRICSTLPLVLAGLLGAASCNSADPEPGPEVRFGELLDVLGASVPGDALIGDAPISFLVCDAQAADDALRFRAQWDAGAGELNTIFDVVPLGALERAAFGERMIEPALAGPGAIYLDASGTTAAALRQRHPGTHLVRVSPDRRIRATQEILPGR
jgi:hypothetical protein